MLETEIKKNTEAVEKNTASLMMLLKVLAAQAITPKTVVIADEVEETPEVVEAEVIEEVEEVEVDDQADEEVTLTMTDIKTAAAAKMKAGQRKAVLKVIAKYTPEGKAEKLSSIPTEDYAAFFADVEAL